MADVEPSFDDQYVDQYRLLGIRYLILPVDAPTPSRLRSSPTARR